MCASLPYVALGTSQALDSMERRAIRMAFVTAMDGSTIHHPVMVSLVTFWNSCHTHYHVGHACRQPCSHTREHSAWCQLVSLAKQLTHSMLPVPVHCLMSHCSLIDSAHCSAVHLPFSSPAPSPACSRLMDHAQTDRCLLLLFKPRQTDETYIHETLPCFHIACALADPALQHDYQLPRADQFEVPRGGGHRQWTHRRGGRRRLWYVHMLLFNVVLV